MCGVCTCVLVVCVKELKFAKFAYFTYFGSKIIIKNNNKQKEKQTTFGRTSLAVFLAILLQNKDACMLRGSRAEEKGVWGDED